VSVKVSNFVSLLWNGSCYTRLLDSKVNDFGLLIARTVLKVLATGGSLPSISTYLFY
jgi:hypothetical protein